MDHIETLSHKVLAIIRGEVTPNRHGEAADKPPAAYPANPPPSTTSVVPVTNDERSETR